MSFVREFTSMGAFADHLLERQALVSHDLRFGLTRVVELIERAAKAKLGHYQNANGPFDAWDPLAESTKQHHTQVIANGDGASDAGEDTPLLLTGKLREDIASDVKGLEGVVGSTLDEGVYMELGTTKAPPRPFLGPALFDNEEAIKRILGAALVSGLLGSSVLTKTIMTSKLIER